MKNHMLQALASLDTALDRLERELDHEFHMDRDRHNLASLAREMRETFDRLQVCAHPCNRNHNRLADDEGPQKARTLQEVSEQIHGKARKP
jgi:hypothetical protein